MMRRYAMDVGLLVAALATAVSVSLHGNVAPVGILSVARFSGPMFALLSFLVPVTVLGYWLFLAFDVRGGSVGSLPGSSRMGRLIAIQICTSLPGVLLAQRLCTSIPTHGGVDVRFEPQLLFAGLGSGCPVSVSIVVALSAAACCVLWWWVVCTSTRADSRAAAGHIAVSVLLIQAMASCTSLLIPLVAVHPLCAVGVMLVRGGDRARHRAPVCSRDSMPHNETEPEA